MKEIFFWKNWQKKYRYLYLFCLTVFLANWFTYLAASFFGTEYFAGWQTVGEIDNITTLREGISVAFFEMSPEVHSFLVSNFFNIAPFRLDGNASLYYLTVLFFGFVLILTVSAYMNRLWFILTNAALILHLSFTSFGTMTFKSNQIASGDPYNIFFLLCLLLFFPLNFYLHTKKSALSLPIRFILFGLLTLGAGYFFVNHYAQVQEKAVFVANYGFLMPMAVTFLFTFFNANEIIHGIFYLTARGGQSSYRNFGIFTVLYLANLAYSFLKSIHFIDFDILHLNPFIIFGITVFIGLWGFRRKEPQYENAVQFTPAGAFLYLGTAIIAMSSIAYSFVTGNSPVIEVYEDMILFSHIGFGIGMAAYVMGNFSLDFATGENLVPRLWKPNVLSYLAAGTFGVVIFIIFLFRYDFYMYRQMHAGYNIGLADAYWLDGEKNVAEEFYKKSLQHDATNERANFMMCMLWEEKNSPNEVKKYLTNALEKNPSPQFYAYAATVYARTNDSEEALKILKRGIEKHPRSAELYNNTAILQMQLLQGDNALDNFLKAKEFSFGEQKALIEGNMYILWAKFNINRDMSLYLDKPKNITGQANYLAVRNAENKIAVEMLTDKTLFKDSVLTGEKLCFLYNYALNKVGESEKDAAEIINRSLQCAENGQYHTFLLFAKANMLYYQGNVHEAILIIRHILSGNSANPYHANLAAVWLSEHGQFEEAARYFQEAMLGHKNDAALNRSVVLSELDDKSSAVRWWRAFDTLPTHPHHTIAKDMLAVLVSDSLKKNDIKKASEQKKLQYLHYQNKNLAHKEYFEVVKTIEEQSFVANAVLDRIEFVLEKNQLDSALSYRSALTGLLNLNNATLNRIKMCDLRLLAETGQFEKMLPLLNEPDENRKTAAQKKLYRAVYQAGMKTDATKLFEEAQKSLPFEPVLYEKAAKYFREIKKTEKAYEFVLKGIQIAPENPKIYRIYLFLALELGYRRYAEEAYRELRSLISPSERDILKAEYEKEYQKLLDNEQNW